MTTQPTSSTDLRDRARRVRLACFDVDGTLTDGRLVFDANGVESKAFHARDGQGLVLLRRAGIEVALVTARTSPIVERRADELGLRAYSGIRDKLQCVENLASELGLDLAQVAFMGDDLPDLKVMQHVGLSACPADAHAWTASRAAWQAKEAGGFGAARAFCDFILQAQDRVDALIEALLAARPVESGAGV